VRLAHSPAPLPATQQPPLVPWSEAEDAALARWQGSLGNAWSEIARRLPGRTGQQCAQRWRHRVNPGIRREPWSAAEDAALSSLVARLGAAWAEIARAMPGRTDQQCAGRWRRCLDPAINRDEWGGVEDSALRQLVAEHGEWSVRSWCWVGGVGGELTRSLRASSRGC
jgi:hypothetical protein